MTIAYIVQISKGDTPQDTLKYRTLFAVGVSLFVITFAVNLLGQRIARKRPGMNYKAKDRALVAICVLALILPLTILVVLIGDVLIDGMDVSASPFSRASQPKTRCRRRQTRARGLCPSGDADGIGCGPLRYWDGDLSSRVRRGHLVASPGSNQHLELSWRPFGHLWTLRARCVCSDARHGTQPDRRAALILALLILPVVVISSLEALRAVPDILRECSLRSRCYALASRSACRPALCAPASRLVAFCRRPAIGETAPLIVVGALTFVTFTPDGIDAPFTALPIQIYLGGATTSRLSRDGRCRYRGPARPVARD